jgi:hypothetical protein
MICAPECIVTPYVGLVCFVLALVRFVVRFADLALVCLADLPLVCLVRFIVASTG